jgi:hypothetical protein
VLNVSFKSFIKVGTNILKRVADTIMSPSQTTEMEKVSEISKMISLMSWECFTTELGVLYYKFKLATLFLLAHQY